MIAFGTIAGGAGAALTGGNFWQGAVTGLVVSGLNHLSNTIEHQSEAIEDPTKVVSQSNPNDVAAGDVVNLHKNQNDALSLWAKQSKPGIGEVEIHAHGSSKSINGMKTVAEIGKLLYDKSPTWKQMVDGGIKIKLKLFSCNTGSGNNNIASQIKAAYPNVTVIAPTNKWVVNYYGFGSFKTVTSGYVQNPGTWKIINQ